MIYEATCPDCGAMILIPVHTHGDVLVPDDPELPEVREHVMWNPELHPTFVTEAPMNTTTLTVEAADKRGGMTVDELRWLLDELDEAPGVTGEEPVRVVVNVRGGIKTVSVEVAG